MKFSLLFPLPVPPEFKQSVGYEGERRFVALYWIPGGDEVVYEDGVISGTGNYQPYLLWARYKGVRRTLSPYNFGGSDEEAQTGYSLTDTTAAFMLVKPCAFPASYGSNPTCLRQKPSGRRDPH